MSHLSTYDYVYKAVSPYGSSLKRLSSKGIKKELNGSTAETAASWKLQLSRNALKVSLEIRFPFDQIFPKNKKSKLCAYSMNNKFHI